MSHPSASSGTSGLARFLPILSWAPRYQRTWLRPDLIAGITVAALVVPKSLGYAGIAGVPIEYGLYAAAAGAILYAIFGLSGQIATGPSSALAAVAAGALVSAGIATGSGDAVALVAAVTIASGLMFLVLRLFRMGWISQFLSKPVITGFLFGAAIEVVIGELPKITGTSAEGTNSWQKLLSWVEGLSATDLTTVVVGVASLVLIFGLKVAAPRLPGALVLLVLGLAASIVLDLGERGVTLIGEVPRGLPSVAFPELDFVGQNITVILTAAVGLLLIGFSQTAGDARSFASKHGARVDIDQESVAQGAANIGSGLLQGIPVSTSLSASSLADSSGAKTQLVVADHRCGGRAHDDPPRAAVLGPAHGGARGDHHPGRGERHDGRAADAAAVPGAADGLLDRHDRARQRPDRRRAGRCRDRRLPLARLPHLHQREPRHAGARSKARHPGLPQRG